MFTERPIHPDVREMLMANTPFKYAHLIKFERPYKPEDVNNVISTSAQRYTYITDASRNVDFNDLSTDQSGNANGSQVYIANKVLSVSSLSESIEAKADTFTLALAGNGLGALSTAAGVVTTSIDSTHWDMVWPASVDLIGAGFREGDKVTITNGASNVDANIESFRANNTIRLKKIDNNLVVGTASITMSLSSEEIKSILANKLDPNYASFINREVYIYRAYFVDGVMVGATPTSDGITGPILIFKGIISTVDFADEDDSIKVQWGLTNQWGDFEQVKGRITSDSFQRALDENGIPQPDSAIKPIYAFDKGFAHAETSVNLLASYVVQVEKQDVKAKNGFLGLGIGAKVKVKKYYVNETDYSNLDVQLAAKSIPVIYGVRSVEGIPVFADTLLNDASTIYIAYVLGEGEMGGLYDVYINGKSSICADKADSDARSVQNSQNTVDVICTGRADRGDVLSGATSVASDSVPFYTPVKTLAGGTYDKNDLATNPAGLSYNYNLYNNYHSYIPPTGAAASVASGGITSGNSIKLTTTQSITLDYFSGREDQAAAPSLVAIAAAKNFKIQNDYWNGGGAAEYWGPNHRLVDSAYVVATIKIDNGDTTIPGLEFIQRGKGLDCYNYDYSYTHDDKSTGESADNFPLGAVVTLKNFATGATIAANVQIIDKWNLVRVDGAVDTRFRWSVDPNLVLDADGKPTITKFYMTDGTHNWTMITHNYQLDAGTVTSELSTPVTSITPADPSTGGTNINIPPTDWAIIPGAGQPTPAVSLRNPDGSAVAGNVSVGSIHSTTTLLHMNKF